MHLESHVHQFAVYIKKKNKDFPDSLLQPFNLLASAGDAPVTKTATKSEEESESESEEEPPPTEEDKKAKEKEQAETEEESSPYEESTVENDEAPLVVPLKCKKKTYHKS